MEQKPTCKKCQASKMLVKNNWFFITLSLYIFFASIYGTIQIFKNISSLF